MVVSPISLDIPPTNRNSAGIPCPSLSPSQDQMSKLPTGNRSLVFFFSKNDRYFWFSHYHTQKQQHPKQYQNTVDGFEILHQLIDGKHIPCIPLFMGFQSYLWCRISSPCLSPLSSGRKKFDVQGLRLWLIIFLCKNKKR